MAQSEVAQTSAGWLALWRQAAFSARSCSRLPGASSQPLGLVALVALAGHLGLGFDRARHVASSRMRLYTPSSMRRKASRPLLAIWIGPPNERYSLVFS